MVDGIKICPVNVSVSALMVEAFDFRLKKIYCQRQGHQVKKCDFWIVKSGAVYCRDPPLACVFLAYV